MASLMITLMVTMTDVFYGIGDFSYKIFAAMKAMGHIPNLILWLIIGFLLCYQVYQMMKQNKEADKNGTLR
ncbi:MAG: hypothetical protein V4580_01115 [Bacteroidota bacterium]